MSPSDDPDRAAWDALDDPADPRPLARTSPAFLPGPVTLAGRLVRLEPLRLEHLEDLARVAFEPEIWRWMRDRPRTLDELRAYLDRALAAADRGDEIPFAQVDLASGRAVGGTRFLAIERTQRRLEIGHTWLGRPYWGTGHNLEAKRLLLGHAFDDLGAHRVEFKTDALNARSRAALAKLGATPEGVFRRHQLSSGDRVRDSAWFAVVWDEWPAVRAGLDARLAGGRRAAGGASAIIGAGGAGSAGSPRSEVPG